MNGHFPTQSEAGQALVESTHPISGSTPPVARATRPQRLPARTSVIPNPHDISRIRSLHDAGRNREALDAAKQLGPLEFWVGGQARLLAGDIARSMGAPRLAAGLHLRAWRRSRSDYDIFAAGLKVLLERRGPWAVWERLRPLKLPESKQAPLAVHKLWLLRARVAGAFRDFETAEGFWQEAEKIAPRSPGVYVTRAALLEREERLEEALASSRRAIELNACHAGAVALTAQLLQKFERDQDSLALLKEANTRIESVPLLAQMASLQSALEQHRDALATLARLRGLSSVLEKPILQWLEGLRLQLLWRAGDVDTAVATARELGDPASLQFAERAQAAGQTGRRVQLDVPFVAQRHDTCAPATMAALGRFWNQPIDQMEVADEITYGGTFCLHQRKWLEKQGWQARPFTVTWETACALLDRGIPFELSTVEVTSGHAQAVCGYDAVQRTLLIRDPNFRHLRQVPAESFLNSYRANGPTGMVLVPLEKATLVQGLELPDERLHDLIYRVWDALEQHDREAARKATVEAQAIAPAHWLTLRANLALAHYEGNQALVLESLESLLKLFPGEPRLLLEKLSALVGQDQRDERLGLLARTCEQPRPHPLFYVSYAKELSQDAREHAQALYWARRAMRLGEMNGGMSCLAGLLWRRGQFEEALEIYRFTTCLADTQEQTARQYFNAARYLNRTDQALQFLRSRFERFGRKSPFPAISLCTMLQNLGRQAEARDVLASAKKLLPENADLDSFAAETALSSGQLDEARACLDRAQGRISAINWQRVSGRIAQQRGDLATALATWREMLAADPHSADAHAAVAQLLAELNGRPAALRHLQQACTDFPWHVQLHKIWFSWQQADDLLASEPIVDRLLALTPRDAEAHRQKARILTARGNFAQALQSAETAIQLDPTHPQSHACRARVLFAQNQLAPAQDSFRRAISLGVDYGEFMAELLRCCNTAFERRLAVDFIRGQLTDHVVHGDGILAFRDLARGNLAPQELLKSLRQLAAQRPDLWQAWLALIHELAAQGEHNEALKLARSAVEKLPEAGPLWEELALLHRQVGNEKAELEAREKVLQLNPGDAGALWGLAGALDRLKQSQRAKSLLEEALLLQPRLSSARLLLAQILRSEEKRDHALEHLKQVIRFAPENEQAWGLLSQWAPSLTLETAQQLSEKRRDDPAVWLRLARLQMAANNIDPALAAVDQALLLDPRSVEAHDLRICLLLEAARLDEALAACQAKPWGTSLPPMLQARYATVLHARGENDAAVATLEKALEETPNLLWGWRLLGSWHLEAGRRAEAEALAQKLLEIGAHDADSYFWVAQMKLGGKETAEGVDLLERALELNPNHLPARVRLMYAQLGTNQFNALNETLRHLQRMGAPDWVCVAQIGLALKQRSLPEAFRHLSRLFDLPFAEDRAVLNAVRELKEQGAAVALEPLLRRQLAKNPPRSIFGQLWLEVCLKQCRLPRAREILKRCPARELRRRAIQCWMDGLPSVPEKKFPGNRLARRTFLSDLRRFEKTDREWFRTNATAWSSYGAALINLRLYGAASRWYADWKQRQSLQRWSLFNIMNTLVSQQRYSEAMEAGTRALAQPATERAAQTSLMLAWLEATSGQPDKAQQRLTGMEPSQLQPLWRIILEIVQATVRSACAPADQQKAVTRAEWNKLRAARDWRGMSHWQLCFRRMFKKSLNLLAANGAGLSARFWAQRMLWRWPWTRGG